MRKVSMAIILIFAMMSSPVACADDQLVASPQLPATFIKYAASSKLGHPGILVIDSKDKTELFNHSADAAHVPASVFKLVSTFTALNFLNPDRTFSTALFTTEKKGTVILLGSRDPWLTSNLVSAQKNEQVYLPALVMKGKTSSRYLTIKYSGLFSKDIANLALYLRKHGVQPSFKEVTPEVAVSQSVNLIAEDQSPPVSEMVKFAILWSDNQLADRLVREAARHENQPSDSAGIQKVIEQALAQHSISTKDLNVIDGAGLDRENRVTPRTIVEILTVVRSNQQFKAIYDGLPIAGESGTLRKRFSTTGTNAIGLVHAKTGWINNVVSLAGYVTVGKDEYVFAIIADGVPGSFKYRNRARETIDAMLGTIATPLNN